MYPYEKGLLSITVNLNIYGYLKIILTIPITFGIFSACAKDQMTAHPPPPTAPTGLTATMVNTLRIDFAWTDNSTNEDGFRIERREGQNGAFVELGVVSTNAGSYVDSSVYPASEYCYRVSSFNESGSSSSSEIACATTPALAAISCTADVQDAQSIVEELLTDPALAGWRSQVGLANADPNQLTLVADDPICQNLWSSISRRNPYPSYLVTFFRISDRYIVTEYPNRDPGGPVVVGYRLTTVLDENFNVVNPARAD